MTRRLPLAVLILGLAACRGPRAWEGARLPANEALPPEVAKAEAEVRDLRGDLAERTLAEAGGLDVAAPERSWVLIDLLEARCGVAEARAAAAALPDGPMAEVLRSHAAKDPEERLRRVRPALGSPVAAWAHLETAEALAAMGGHSAALRSHAVRAATIGCLFVRREALLLAGSEALEEDRAGEAATLAARARAIDPTDPRALSLEARAAARLGKLDEGALLAWQALRLAPKSGRSARRVADILRDGTTPAVEGRIRAEIGPLLGAADVAAEMTALGGVLAEHAGDDAAALARYEKALRDGADPVPVDRDLRRLLWAAGRRQEARTWLLAAVPPQVIDDPRNVVRERWTAVRLAVERAGDGSAASPSEDPLADLASALVGVGAVEDAAAVARPLTSERGRALRARCESYLAFEKAFRAAVERAYRALAAGQSPPSLDALLEEIREIAGRLLGPQDRAAFEPTALGRRDVPFLGTWLDHSTDTTSALVRWFRGYGKLLILGQRAGMPPEAILLSAASLTRSQEIRTGGRVLHHDVAVGYDLRVRSYLDYRGGTLSGASLPDGVWLDADAARREEHAIRATLRIVDSAYLARLERAAREPPVPDGIEGPFALDDPAGVTVRLARRYAARAGADPWGSFEVLKAHESGHVLDLARHLPLVRGLPATVSLLASEGFAFRRVEARLEGRAQLAAVADGRDPDLALVDLVVVLPQVERVPEAHERGYRDVVAAMVRWIGRHAGDFPRIDPTRKILPQLDRLTPEEIRAVARGVQREGWDDLMR